MLSQVSEKDNQIKDYVEKLHRISLEMGVNPPKKNEIFTQLRHAEEMNAEFLHSVMELTQRVEILAANGEKMSEKLDEAQRKYQIQTEKLCRTISDKQELEEQLSNFFTALQEN